MSSDRNQHIFERDAEVYAGFALQRPEQALLGRFREGWPQMSMLDIGVGTGRTTYTFAPLVGRYVGVDYAARMIELAREVIDEDERIQFLVADARRLTDAVDGPFDLVLFSFNGIDAVDHAERLDVLRQVRAVIDDDGWFCFSSHSAHTLPLSQPPLSIDLRAPARSAIRGLRAIRTARDIRRANRRIDLSGLHERGWGLVADGAHRFEECWYYVVPQYQVEQLDANGFCDVEVYDRAGRRVDPAAPGDDPWLYYLCRPKG